MVYFYFILLRYKFLNYSFVLKIVIFHVHSFLVYFNFSKNSLLLPFQVNSKSSKSFYFYRNFIWILNCCFIEFFSLKYTSKYSNDEHFCFRKRNSFINISHFQERLLYYVRPNLSQIELWRNGTDDHY